MYWNLVILTIVNVICQLPFMKLRTTRKKANTTIAIVMRWLGIVHVSSNGMYTCNDNKIIKIMAMSYNTVPNTHGCSKKDSKRFFDYECIKQ